jgi:alginate O-acetyltransferase complex protein AlgJ
MTWFKTNTFRWLSWTVIGFTSSLAMLISNTQAQQTQPLVQAQQTGPKQVPGTNISIGKDNYLFGNLHIFSGFNTSTQERLNRNLETVVQIKQALLQRNIQLAVIYVPFVGRIYPERLPDDFKIPTRMQAAYATSLKKWRENGVFAPDLNEAFMKAKGPAGNEFPLYMRQDNHWSTIGAFEAAKVVAAGINTKFKSTLAGLPEKNSSYEWLPPLVHDGNYYHSLPAAERAKLVEERLKPLRFTQNSGNDLLSAETPGVVLVGSSFSKLQQFSFADSLAHFLRRDVLNVAQSGKSFWTPLLDYLASDAFVNTPPKLLIWEIPEEHFAPGSGPVDWVDAWSRRQYLLELGANLTGDCTSSGLQPVATTAADFNGDITAMKVESTNAKSFVKYQFNAPIRPDQYLSIRAKSASSDSFLVESASSKPQRYYSRLTGYGSFHQVNVPLATLSDGQVKSLIVRTASGSDFALEAPKLCTMSAAFSERANANR